MNINKNKKNAKIKKKTNRVQHAAAVKTTGTRSKIDRLYRNWDKMSKVRRGKQVRDLIERGCTLRGLSDYLQKSITSIRRYRDIGRLPKEQQARIAAGDSAKVILNHEALKARELRRVKAYKAQGLEKVYGRREYYSRAGRSRDPRHAIGGQRRRRLFGLR